MKMLKAKKAKFPKTIKVEGVSGITATIYRQERTKADTSDKLRTYVSYLLSYSLLGKRKVESFADLIEAEGAGETAIKKIANGEQRILQLNNRDQLCYQRAQESLSGLNVALDTACAQYAEALRALNGKGTLLEACQDFARRHGSITTKLMVPDAVKKMIEQEESQQDGKRKQAWVKLLKAHLQGEGKFAQSFNCEVGRVESRELNQWLTGLKCSERTKKNARDCVGHFFKWCRGQGYLSKDADPLANVSDFRKRRRGAIHILTSDELRKLLKHVEADLLPYIALRAFAGLRDSEATAIDYRHIDLKEGWIEITEEVAKASDDDDGTRRLIPIRDCLKTWLAPYAKSSGRVCPFDNTSKQIAALCEKAGVEWKRNCLRHSYISYAIAESNDIPTVAIHSGNSPAVIRKHYLRVVKPAQAKAWFGVLPTGAAE